MEVTRKPHLHQDWIDPHAYGIVKALQKGGFTTYLVGGCVRDLLLNIHPKDFDIVTMAAPQQVKRLISMAFIIGKRFRLVLVKRENRQFEVATFRREIDPTEFPEGELPEGDNVFGTPEEDALRRDFTINGLFYDPVNEQLIDYVDGLPDIKTRVMRMIGNPDVRLAEDPIRILRGLRLAHKLRFSLEPTLRQAMTQKAPELLKSVLPRRREEILKILRLDHPELALLECLDLGLLAQFLPTLHHLLSNPGRCDVFLQCFEVFRSLVNDFDDPAQLFAWLVYSMLETARLSPSERATPISIEDDVFQHFMREELGMYKFEQVTLAKAVELLQALKQTEDFKRRGERKQLALMRNEGFKLALRIAEADFLLSPQQARFWHEIFDRHAEELDEFAVEAKTKRRRPRRNRRRGGTPSSSAERLETAQQVPE